MEITKRCIISAAFTWALILSIPAQDWVRSFGHPEGDAVITGLVTDTENHLLVTGTFSSPGTCIG